MAPIKIIFGGPVGSGKTTAIRTLSDIPPICTDVRASEPDIVRDTTVALDYGLIKVGENERIHLYGAPGAARFGFMWEILAKGASGLILLMDNSRSDPFDDLKFFLKTFAGLTERAKLAVGVTHMDERPWPAIDDYHRQFFGTGLRPAIFQVDARARRDVSLLVQGLLYSLDPGLNDDWTEPSDIASPSTWNDTDA